MSLSNFRSNEEGSVSTLVALLMVVLVGTLALVTDAGLLYINQGKMHNALDSAVLAGVRELPANPQEALQVAGNYGSLNGLSTEEASFQLDSDQHSISGYAERQVELGFARALGFTSKIVAVSAKARIAPISSTGGVVPFGVIEGNFTFGQEITLKEGAGDQEYNGWFGALSLGGSGAHIYRDNIKYGYPEEISIGDIIDIEAGNMSGPTRAGVEYRLNQCEHIPQCSINSYVEGCPRILIVPIVNIEELNESGHPFTVKVKGFGAFLVEEYTGNGNDNQVRGAFIQYVIPGKPSSDAGDFGLYGVQLIE
ncbi:MAG: pilus assembly protein TadG-related protein [Syntrophomonadaceae bacterium]|nr:pilus assembly protein TadG-related protein [Syntrophomonadaceae bacterium]